MIQIAGLNETVPPAVAVHDFAELLDTRNDA
jgi:hypothetical protein